MCKQQVYFYSASRADRSGYIWGGGAGLLIGRGVCISSPQVSLKPNWLCVSVCDIQARHTQLIFQIWLSLGGEKMVRNSDPECDGAAGRADITPLQYYTEYYSLNVSPVFKSIHQKWSHVPLNTWKILRAELHAARGHVTPPPLRVSV